MRGGRVGTGDGDGGRQGDCKEGGARSLEWLMAVNRQ